MSGIITTLLLQGNGDLKKGAERVQKQVAGAAAGRREGFASSGDAAAVGIAITLTVLYFLLVLLQAIAAAKLSLTYNMAIGTGGFLTAVYAVLCFLFADFYFVYYAFGLDPVATMGAVGGNSGGVGQLGGQRRRR